jgi:peptide/nickel transport system permease protein
MADMNLATEKNENEIANRDTVGLSQKQIILRRFVKHKAAMGSLVVLISIIFFVFSASGFQLGKGILAHQRLKVHVL